MARQSAFSALSGAILLGALLLLPASSPTLSPEGAEEAILEGRFAEAAADLARLVERAGGPERERLLLLLGEARLQANDPEAGLAALARLLEEAPAGVWADRAAYRRAEVLGQAGRHREAAEILARKVGELLAPERKERIAAICLHLADRVLAGHKPDRVRGRALLDLAADVGLVGAKAEEVGFRAARVAAEAEDWGDAAKRLRGFLDAWPKSARSSEAGLLLGTALRKTGKLLAARQLLRAVVREGGEVAPRALRELARTFGLPSPEDDGALAQGAAALRRLLKDYPASPEAPQAALELAWAWLHRGRHDEALAEAERLIAASGGRNVPEAAEARALQGKILRDQGRHQEALAAFRTYLAQHPEGKQWKEVQAALVACEGEEAQALLARGREHLSEAIAAVRRFVAAHPLDPLAPGLMLQAGKVEMEREAWAGALALLQETALRFPDADQAGEAWFLMGDIHERRLADPVRAAEEWSRLEKGPWAVRARERLRALREPALSVHVERVLRTDETARFRLVSRNVPEVRVRVYRLDQEAFFRATHSAAAVERLEVEVVEPDRAFATQVEGYRPGLETTREVELGLTGPGAYVVKVDDRKLEATTLVLVSDLELIVKAARTGLLAFAQDARRERPAAGAKVFVSDGERLLAEGETGSDGVWRLADPRLLEIGALRVFVLGKDGSGAANVGLAGLGAPKGLEAKGFVATERPGYRPGQKVGYRAVLRDVEDGLYVLPRRRSYVARLLDPGGMEVASQRLETGPFGTLAGELGLPPGVSPGRWQVQVRPIEAGSRAFAGGFQVAEYALPRVRLRLEPGSLVVLRGEALAGRARLEWFHGGPVAGEPLRVTLVAPGGSLMAEGTTDAAGSLPFRFETDDLPGEAMVELEAAAPARDASVRERVLVAAVAMKPAVELPRDVYLTGETVEAEVKTADRLGRPVAARLTVALVRKVKGPGGVLAEREVLRREGATDGVAGRWRVAFPLAEGGLYAIRAWGEDRLGAVVSGEAGLSVSGDDDEIRVRLLTDRERWCVGERARVRVVNRTGRRLGLLTAEADGILAWWVRELPLGESPFDLDLVQAHAPGFRLALSVADRGRLHEAAREFLVEQGLQVEVRPDRAEARPGETLGIALVARAPDGKPARAELAVAVVDEALLALFPAAWIGIERFFYDVSRVHGVRTASSCAFRHQGFQAQVSEELLREEARQEEEGKKAAAKLLKPGFLAAGEDAPAEKPAAEEPPFEGDAFNDVIGIGGGAGGHSKFGGRAARGGSRNGGDGTVAPPREDFPETALWLPAVLTGPDGAARVEVPLPGSLTTWRVRVRGVTTETLVGQAEASFMVSQPLQAELDLPGRVQVGDRLQPVAVVRNFGSEPRRVALRIEATQIAGLGREETPAAAASGVQAAVILREERELEVPAGGSAGFPFALETAAPGEIRVAVSAAAAGGEGDFLLRRLRVEPLGTEFLAAASGVEEGDREVVLALPEGREWERRTLEVTAGGGVAGDLVRAALAGPAHCRGIRVETRLAGVCRGLGALAALAVAGRGTAGEGDAARLRGLLEEEVATLAGTWWTDGWSASKGEEADPQATALGLRFLAGARAAGLEVPEGLLDRARKAVSRAWGGTGEGWQRGRLAEAMAASGGVPLEWLMLLRRQAADLGPAGAAMLAAAFARSGRPEGTAELARVVREGVRPEAGGLARWDGPEGSVAATGAAVQALLLADPRDSLARQGASWLRSRRGHGGWVNPIGHAAAMEALCLLEGQAAAEAAEGELLLLVNGLEAGRFPLRRGQPEARVLTEERLAAGANRIAFKLAGRGRYAWQAELRGLTKGLVAELEDRHLEVERTLLALPPLRQGKRLPAGFSVVAGPVKTFENIATQVPVGGMIQVRLRIAGGDEGRRGTGPLVVVEPLPAGCSLVPGSVQGPLAHHESREGRLLLFLARRSRQVEVSYELAGSVGGSWQVLPTRVFPAAAPEEISEGAPGRLEVGGEPRDKYEATPDELLALGIALAQEGADREAAALLDRLVQGWRLEPEPRKKAARALFDAGGRLGEPARLVRAFELLREAEPEGALPFAAVRQVGEAYLAMGEFERAGQVLLALAEASFAREARVAGVLEKAGRPLEAADQLLRLCLSYSPVPAIRQAFLAVGQELARRAEELAPGERLGGTDGPGALELRQRSLWVLREFLLLHPQDGQAPEAAFSLAQGWLDLKDWDRALARAAAGAARFASSRWADELLFLEGYARFARGEHAEALAVLGRVAAGRFPDGAGGEAESDSRWYALHLMAQIHHAKGERAEAERLYGLVRDRFADAAASLERIRERRLELPAMTVLGPQEPGGVDLVWRNLEEAVLRIYRVDLVRLYTLRRSLSGIREVQLAGIRPTREERIALPGHGLFGEGRLRLALPAGEPGAWLVMVQAGDLVASGLFLRTGLALGVVEEAGAGRVEVQVLRGGRPVAGAYVKVVGSDDGRFRSGETDLRGGYAVAGLQGRATVLVKAGEEYAFHQGEVDLAGRPGKQAGKGGDAGRAAAPAGAGALEGLEAGGKALRGEARGRLDRLFRGGEEGVNLRLVR